MVYDFHVRLYLLEIKVWQIFLTILDLVFFGFYSFYFTQDQWVKFIKIVHPWKFILSDVSHNNPKIP